MDREKLLAEIRNVQDAMSGTYVTDDEYDKLLDRFTKLNALLEKIDAKKEAEKETERKAKSEKWANATKIIQTSLTVGAGTACVVMIVCAETAVPKILNSKALGTALKLAIPKI